MSDPLPEDFMKAVRDGTLDARLDQAWAFVRESLDAFGIARAALLEIHSTGESAFWDLVNIAMSLCVSEAAKRKGEIQGMEKQDS